MFSLIETIAMLSCSKTSLGFFSFSLGSLEIIGTERIALACSKDESTLCYASLHADAPLLQHDIGDSKSFSVLRPGVAFPIFSEPIIPQPQIAAFNWGGLWRHTQNIQQKLWLSIFSRVFN